MAMGERRMVGARSMHVPFLEGAPAHGFLKNWIMAVSRQNKLVVIDLRKGGSGGRSGA